MKAFRYRLESLLHLAAAERRESAGHLARESELLRRREEDWEAAAERRRRAEGARRVEPGARMSLARWLDLEAEAELGRRGEALAARRVDEQRDRVERRRGEYLSARRDERMLESLKAREHRRWRVESGRSEQRLLDDLARVAHDLRSSSPLRGRGLSSHAGREGGEEAGQVDPVN